MGRIKVDQETRSEIIEMIKDGKSPKDIAEELGFTDSSYIRGIKHDLKRTNANGNDLPTLEISIRNANNDIKTLDEREVIRSELEEQQTSPDILLKRMLEDENEHKNAFSSTNNVFESETNVPSNERNGKETFPNAESNGKKQSKTLENQNANILFSSILLGLMIACLKFNGIDEVKLVLKQFSIAKDSVGLVSLVLVAAPLVLLLQPQNEKTHYYSVAIFVIVCLLQVFCSAMSISQALETPFETAIKNTIHIEKNTFTYFMSPIRPLLELLMELVLLGNLKQRSA